MEQVAPEEMVALLVGMVEMVEMGGEVAMTAMEPETAAITGTVMGVIMVMAQIREITVVMARAMETGMVTVMATHPETIMVAKGMGADYEQVSDYFIVVMFIFYRDNLCGTGSKKYS